MKVIKNNIFPLTLFMVLSILIVWAGFRFEPVLSLASDGFFHYYRFEYLYKNVQDLNFFNDFYTEGYLYEFGYPTGIFYPQMMFYPFVILSLLLNLSPIRGFQLTLILLSFIVLTSAYFAVKMFNKGKVSDKNLWMVGLFGSLTYAFLPTILPMDFTRPFNSYLTFNISARHSVAEFFAFIFFPWVIVGMQKIFQEKPKGTTLLFALLGVLYSHILSGVFVGVGIVLFCLFKAKDIIGNKDRLKELFKVLGLFILLGAYQIFPMAEMMAFQDYAYNEPFFDSGKLLIHAIPFGVESLPRLFILVQVLIGLILIGSFLYYKRTESRLLITGLIGLYVSSVFFPWQYMDNTIIRYIQFPSRMVTTLSLFWAFSLPILLRVDKCKIRRYVLTFMLSFFIFANLYSSYHMQSHPGRLLTDIELEEKYGSVVTIGHGAEYLPHDFDINDGVYEKPNGFNLNYVFAKFTKLRTIALDDDYLLPKLYYKGYKVTYGGKEIPIHSGYSGLIATDIPLGENEVEVVRERSLIQNTSFMLSVGTLIGWVYAWRKKRGKGSE